jgi:surfactin synthase thioesterase subunit
MTPFLDKPAAFFGHCLGGLTAFETARRLRQQGGLDLRHLFVSGARAPRRLNRPGRFEENLLARLLERPEFDARVALYDQAEDVVAEMIRQFNIGLTEDFLASAELRTLLMPAIRAEFRMGAHYRFTAETPWETAITCFTGIDDPYVTREDALGWSEHTRRLFRLHLRAGAHFLVVDDRDFIVETINREVER